MLRVKRPHTSLLAAGAMLMAAADDGFWEDEDEAHDWTCVGFALMAVACVQGKRRRSILGNNYDPLDLMGEDTIAATGSSSCGGDESDGSSQS